MSLYSHTTRSHPTDTIDSGAACEAALEGLPAADLSQVSYTTLETDPGSITSISTFIYAPLTITFLRHLLADPARPTLPAGVALNVNYPQTTTNGYNCTHPKDFGWVFT